MTINNDDIDDKDDKTGQGGEEGGEGGKGGKSGEIHFRYQDAMSLPQRDDLLPPEEIRRLLIVQKELHKSHVDKQKSTRKERTAIKEGRVQYDHRAGLRAGYGSGSQFKKHWISNKAQFSGIDRQVVGVPTENRAETNEANRNELENRLQLRHAHRNVPKFNPKPRPY